MHCYLRDFRDAFGLMDAVRLNARVLRVARAAMSTSRRWTVRSARRLHVHGKDVDADDVQEDEEVFDAVVVATGHYAQRHAGRGGMEAPELHSL
ncbi:hypothetical protein ZWY2020_059872 [Hordeum vulgare]|nr:hypothetical protein ZWY2020_059872 [Hordeum vulgare]